ncbi:MAG TPA: AAA family ATPase, partial [Candidatus Limnocylindrales bacterium]
MIDPSRSPVFVGRAAEMALLDGALAQAMGGRPAVVVVGGEAGIGKSRLVSEFAARAAGDALVLVGRCHPGPTVLPYAPLAEVLRELAARLPSDELAAVLGPAASELGVVVPELERPGRAPAPDLPVESRAIARTRLLGLLAGIVDRLAELTPVAVAIEDVQWADAASIDALEFLVRAANRQRTLLVVTVRTDEGAVRARLPAIAELERAGSVERVELRRLTRTEVAAQIAGALGTAPGDDLAARIAARSDGNPFFVEELLAAERRGDPIGLTPRLDDLMRA